MKVPLTVSDFLDRAELVYGDRVGDRRRARPAGRRRGARSPTRELGERARAQAAGARRARRRPGRAGGDRVAQRGPAARRVLRRVSGWGRILVPINFRLNAEEIALHRRALRGRRCCWSTPSSTTSLAGRRRAAPVRARRRRRRATCCLDGAEPAAVGRPTRTPPPPSTTRRGTTARPKGVQLTHRNALGQRRHVRLARRRVSDRDVYLHTLPMFHCNGWGMPYAITGMGAHPGRAAQGRRRRDPAPRRASTASRCCAARPAVVAAILDAAAELGRADPRRGPHPHRRGRRPAAHPHHRAGRDRAGLGVHPDLRPHRDGAAADDEPGAGPSATT